MKLNLILFSLSAPFVVSQCLIEFPEYAKFEVRKGCNYEKVLVKINQQRKALMVDKGVTCLKRVGELGALLGLGEDEAAMEAKINSICDEAISHSRTDTDYSIDFSTIPLIEDDADEETVNRFMKEYFDGGKSFLP